MLSRIQYLVEGAFRSTATVFYNIGLTPNGVTILGFVLTIVASVFYALGLASTLIWSGCVIAIVVGSYFDALDGAMARKYARVSRFGGVLDSILDRLGEIAIYVGLAVGNLIPSLLALWVVSASLMVSYIRARVGVEGITLKGVGIAERPERLLIILVATILWPMNPLILLWAVIIVAFLASVTVVERLYRVSRNFLTEENLSGQKRLSSRERTLDTPK